MPHPPIKLFQSRREPIEVPEGDSLIVESERAREIPFGADHQAIGGNLVVGISVFIEISASFEKGGEMKRKVFRKGISPGEITVFNERYAHFLEFARAHFGRVLNAGNASGLSFSPTDYMRYAVSLKARGLYAYSVTIEDGDLGVGRIGGDAPDVGPIVDLQAVLARAGQF